MDRKSKLDIYEIVKVNKEAIIAAYSNDVKRGWMSNERLDYLVDYPIATIKDKKQDQDGKWQYLIYFLGSDVDEAFFQEGMLNSTGQFISPSKFKYLEIVKIVNPSEEHKKIQYFQGIVSGPALDIYGNWYYYVDFPHGTNLFEENELDTTGEFVEKNPFLTDEHVRVKVQPDGRGDLKQVE